MCDGWQEIGSGPTRQYHMNYGWGGTGTCQDGCNTWYTLDALHLGGYDEEQMLIRVRPNVGLAASISGTYPRESFPWRYFMMDTTGSSASFSAGQNLQFLPRISLKCISSSGQYIRFRGTSSNNTRLYSIDGTQSAGIQIYDGGIRLYQNGSIRFH